VQRLNKRTVALGMLHDLRQKGGRFPTRRSRGFFCCGLAGRPAWQPAWWRGLPVASWGPYVPRAWLRAELDQRVPRSRGVPFWLWVVGILSQQRHPSCWLPCWLLERGLVVPVPGIRWNRDSLLAACPKLARSAQGAAADLPEAAGRLPQLAQSIHAVAKLSAGGGRRPVGRGWVAVLLGKPLLVAGELSNTVE